MLRFFEFLQERNLEEGNPLYQKIEKPLSKGQKIGTVSAERYTRTPELNKQANKSLKGDLKRLAHKGAIGDFRSVQGRYQDKDKAQGDVDKESAFVVRQGRGKKGKHFDKILSALGKRYGQQTTMHVNPNKEAEYRFPDDKKKVEKLGKVTYNKPLVVPKGQQGTGDTAFGKKGSFTTR